jgi:hypothetical protein
LKLPPWTIISLPVQTAAWNERCDGASTRLVGVQEFVAGL